MEKQESQGAGEGGKPEKLFLFDVDFVSFHGTPALRLVFKNERGKTLRLYDTEFEPYFYLKPRAAADLKKTAQEIAGLRGAGGDARPKRVEEAERSFGGRRARLLKIFCFHPKHVPPLREESRRFGEPFESDVSFTRRFLYDHGLYPNNWFEVEHDEKNPFLLKKISAVREQLPEPALRALAFDIETYNPSGMPDAERDPAIMISFATPRDGSTESGVLSFEKKFSASFVRALSSEKEMLEAFAALVKENRTDLLCTYNGDAFDLPYLSTRAKKTRAAFLLGRDRSPVRSKKLGLRAVSWVGGRVHFDVFSAASFLNTIGAIRLPRLTLERVYADVLGKQKPDVKKLEIWKTWDAGGLALDSLAEYCRSDSVACLELALHFLPLEIALARVTGIPLSDASRATTGQLVEALLMRNAFARGEIVPNKPRHEEIRVRSENPIQGAFVKMPEPGVYENVAVLDFRSLYPSIIISHNIDPTTLNCDCCPKEEAFVSPQGHRFCAKRVGLIPFVLNAVVEERMRVKKEVKKLGKESKESSEYKELDARQWALKIVANSFYGYLVYARSRWYSRECGESVTAWGRQYIQDTMRAAEQAGFKVIYGDTDSMMLQFNKGGEEKVTEFQKKVNDSLPEKMELELEDFYPRGLFVAKKQDIAKGAKKKYALINREGKIKIRGFELVRRDWSRVARRTQREVLEILLKEGDVKKALAFVRDVIAKLKAGETPLEDCVIYTQLQKRTGTYEIKSPELGAVLQARKAGLQIPEGAVVGYVITRAGKTISDKAQVAELARDYDADYYVNNQVLPAVLKILGALGVSEEDLKMMGSQSKLGGW